MNEPARSYTLAGGRVLHGTPPRLDLLDVVVKDGVITELANAPSPTDTIVDVAGCVVTPGLVNGHTHSYGQVCRHLAVDSRLDSWLPRALIDAAALDGHALCVAAQLNALDNLRHGVTSSLDHASLSGDALGAVIEGYSVIGARAVIALQVGDRPPGDWLATDEPIDRHTRELRRHLPVPASAAELADRTERLLDMVSGYPLVTAQVGPSAPDRCSPDLLKRLAAIAERHDVGIHTHLAETPHQGRSGGVETLRRCGLLGPRTAVAHAIHIDDDDRRHLAAASASVIHDPLCNLLLGSGNAKLLDLVHAGINVGLGTDGWPTGGAQDPLVQARVALGISRTDADAAEWLKPAAIMPMLTTAAASAIGLGAAVGQIAVGYRADLLVVDPDRANWLSRADSVDQLILSGLGAGLRSVYVDGVEVLRDGEPVLIDSQVLFEEANALNLLKNSEAMRLELTVT